MDTIGFIIKKPFIDPHFTKKGRFHEGCMATNGF